MPIFDIWSVSIFETFLHICRAFGTHGTHACAVSQMSHSYMVEPYFGTIGTRVPNAYGVFRLHDLSSRDPTLLILISQIIGICWHFRQCHESQILANATHLKSLL